MRKIDTIIIHCSDSPFGDAITIDGWHRKNGWDCIGYHYVIDNDSDPIRMSDGVIEAGRPLDKQGAHAYRYNRTSIGVCLIGEPGTSFTGQQLHSLRWLCVNLMGQFNIAPERLLGHYELDSRKICPGVDMELLRDWILRYDHSVFEKLTR